MECPANDFPPHTTLLPEPVVLTDNTFVVIPPTRRPQFGDEFTFYASFILDTSASTYLFFYGTNSSTINFAVQIGPVMRDNIVVEGRSRLTIQHSGGQPVSFVSFDLPLLRDGNEHCLLFTFPLIRVFIDDVQMDLSGTLNLGFFQLQASNVAENLGVSRMSC